MAIREVGGNWSPGMISQMFRKSTKRNSDPRNGVNRVASLPMTSRVMPLSTNS